MSAEDLALGADSSDLSSRRNTGSILHLSRLNDLLGNALRRAVRRIDQLEHTVADVQQRVDFLEGQSRKRPRTAGAVSFPFLQCGVNPNLYSGVQGWTAVRTR